MTKVVRKTIRADVEMVGERQVRVICSTAGVDRGGEIVVQDGIDLSGYKSNPIVLWQHDVNFPIGRAPDVDVKAGKLSTLVDFAPVGISPKADEICGLVKAGIINAVSIGFTPLETEPLDKANPKKGPQKYLKSELCELSFVSVPANRDALVVERQNQSDDAEWKCGASRNLEVDTSEDWDAAAAEASIFAKAGFDGDDPDFTFARKGFLAYDAAAPAKKSSYKLPFAHVKDGRLVAVKGSITVTASRLPKTGISGDVATKARAVLDHYEDKMKDKAAAADVTKDGNRRVVKNLYDVANLAYALLQLGYLQLDAAWEAEVEGDGSKVPAMLADSCRQLADTLIAMTQEEVAELLAGMAPADSAEDGVAKSLIAKGVLATGATNLRKALAVAGMIGKAGRKFSTASENTMREACKSIADGHDMIKSGHDRIMGLVDDASDEDGDAADTETSSSTATSSDTDDDKAKAARQARLRELDLLRLAAV